MAPPSLAICRCRSVRREAALGSAATPREGARDADGGRNPRAGRPTLDPRAEVNSTPVEPVEEALRGFPQPTGAVSAEDAGRRRSLPRPRRAEQAERRRVAVFSIESDTRVLAGAFGTAVLARARPEVEEADGWFSPNLDDHRIVAVRVRAVAVARVPLPRARPCPVRRPLGRAPPDFRHVGLLLPHALPP